MDIAGSLDSNAFDFDGKKLIETTNKENGDIEFSLNGKDYVLEYSLDENRDTRYGERIDGWKLDGKLIRFIQSQHWVANGYEDEKTGEWFEDRIDEYNAFTIVDGYIILINDYSIGENSVTIEPKDYGVDKWEQTRVFAIPINVHNMAIIHDIQSNEPGTDWNISLIDPQDRKFVDDYVAKHSEEIAKCGTILPNQIWAAVSGESKEEEQSTTPGEQEGQGPSF